METRTYNSFMLIDDNKYDNFYHDRVIKNSLPSSTTTCMLSAREALDYFNSKSPDDDTIPDIIFLDINMPGMNGWEFLSEFSRFNNNKKNPRVVMLSTSDDPRDIMQTVSHDYLWDYVVKPLTRNALINLVTRFSNDRPEAFIH